MNLQLIFSTFQKIQQQLIHPSIPLPSTVAWNPLQFTGTAGGEEAPSIRKARRGQLTTYPSVAGKLYMSSFHRAFMQVKNSTKNAVWTFSRQVMHLWCPALDCQLTYWTNSSAQCKRSHEYRVACATWWDNRLQAKPAHFRGNPITIHEI